MISKATKTKIIQNLPRYKYVFEVPKNFKDTQKLNKKNDNTKWMDLNKLDHNQLDKYDVFIDKGKSEGCKISRGFRLIRFYTIFNVKVDGRNKSHVVADGNLTATSSDSVYSGVV